MDNTASKLTVDVRNISNMMVLLRNILQDVYQQVCTNYAPQFMELKERNETDSRELLRSGESRGIVVVLIMFHNRFLASFSETSFSSWFDDPATTGSG